MLTLMVIISFGLTEHLGSVTPQSFIGRSIIVVSWRTTRQNLSHYDERRATWILHAGPLACTKPGEKIQYPGGSQGLCQNWIVILRCIYKWKRNFLKAADKLHSSFLHLWEYFSFKVYYSEERKPWISFTSCSYMFADNQ